MANSNTSDPQVRKGAQTPAGVSQAPPDDLTGRDRMVRNVLASWAGQVIFIVAGFIMPRLINDSLSRTALGVWDFGWSVVAYLTLTQAGIVASINRYVAKFRAVGDLGSVNTVVSSVWVALLAAGALGLLAGAGIALVLPVFLRGRLAGYLMEAQWVVILLSASTSLQTVSATFGGVITGCHRWGIYNLILAGGRALVVGAMILNLLSGGGLVGMAAVTLAGEALAGLARYSVARQILPEMRVRLGLAKWRTLRSMLAFGGKSLVPRIADLLLVQTTNVMIMSFLGAPALALFARPMSLIRHARTLLTRFTFILTPTAGSLQAMNRPSELKRLLVTATRYGAFILLPIMVVLLVFGDILLGIWMGQEYADAALVRTLAAGYSVVLLQLPATCVITGMNAHGRLAFAYLAAAIVSLGFVAIALGMLKAGLAGAALGMVLPITIVNATYVPLYVCRRVGLPVSQYLIRGLATPLACAVPFGVCLLMVRVLLPQTPVRTLVAGSLCSGTVLAVLYWRYALSRPLRRSVLRRVGQGAAILRGWAAQRRRK